MSSSPSGSNHAHALQAMPTVGPSPLQTKCKPIWADTKRVSNLVQFNRITCRCKRSRPNSHLSTPVCRKCRHKLENTFEGLAFNHVSHFLGMHTAPAQKQESRQLIYQSIAMVDLLPYKHNWSKKNIRLQLKSSFLHKLKQPKQNGENPL